MTPHVFSNLNSESKDQEVKIFNSKIQMMGSSLNVFCYLVDGMLIDSGPHRMEKEISDFCSQHRPDKIVHTHYHEDHTGNTSYLMREFQIPSYIHSESIEICQDKGKIPLYRFVFWGTRKNFNPLVLPDSIENNHSRFEVLHTPGHT